MVEVMQEKNVYLTDFERCEKRWASQDPPALHRLCQSAVARFTELGFPRPRDEEWRFTNLAPLLKVPFAVAPEGAAELDYYLAPQPADVPGTVVLCINGRRPFVQHQGPPLPPGVIVGSLADALESHPDLVEAHLARHADYQEHAFTALNTAFLQDGAFVYVPPDTVVPNPVTCYFLANATGGPFVWHRRTLVVAGPGSKLPLVINYEGTPGTTYFTNAVTEVVVGDNAHVDHYKLQKEGTDAFHVATLQVRLGRGSHFASHSIVLGGAFVRNEANAVLAGQGCECTLNGLYLASGQQLIDNHTFIDHAEPHCASHELYKGILDGKARGVFNGKIFVRQDAQKTDAKQTNKTLLLSDDATIDTKPQLEIYADDVKCTHGATVGQLDAESLFYLRSRGIGHAEARALLTYAFANDVVGRIEIGWVRDRLERALLEAQHLPAAETAEEET